ncbi:MAG: aromatic-ring-hydroxylating dioxygenase subunit beta [Casimicrobiaceae bacterium]
MNMVEEAKNLVALSCLLLDDEKFDEYLSLLSPRYHYCIKAYSPDLRKDVVFLDLDRGELEVLFRNLPKHVRLPGRFMRHANTSVVQSHDSQDRLSITTSLLVTHTDLEGVSRVFATGRYRDKIARIEGKPLLEEREVRLDTRQFGPGSHIPL